MAVNAIKGVSRWRGQTETRIVGATAIAVRSAGHPCTLEAYGSEQEEAQDEEASD
jgi:hypothetical protein